MNTTHETHADDAPTRTADTPSDEGIDDVDETSDAVSTDGRTLRRRRNRDAVIDALISLIQEGELSPTVAKIADRAEVSHRSIFRYFDDLNDLARTAIETEFRKSIGLSVIADMGQGGLEYRVDTMIEKQLAILARTHALGRVARTRVVDIPEVDRGMATIMEFRIEQVRQHFAPELDELDDDRRDAIVTAITMAVGFESYDLQLRTLDRTPNEIARNWRVALLALLG